MVDKDWQERTKGILKAELKRKGLSYRDLAERLSAMGVPETETNIKNKIKSPQGEIELNQQVSLNLDTGKTITKMQSPIGEITQGFDGTVMWANAT